MEQGDGNIYVAYKQKMSELIVWHFSYMVFIYAYTSTEEIDAKVQALTNEMEEVQLLVENLIHDNARRNQDQEEYERHYQELVSQFNAAKARMESLLEEKQSKLDRIEILNAFIASLEDKETVIDEFSTDLWNLMIQDALVNEDGTIKFVFKNGAEIAK